MSKQMINIDIFTDYVCPWCYLSSAAVEKIVQQYPVKVRWLPFPLHPETPQEGLALSELFQGRNMDSMHAQLHARMDEAGLEHCQRSMTYNSRLAQELAQWADTQEGGEAIHKALYQAYFVDNQNLADHQVLLKIIEEIGLDKVTASKVLNERLYSKQVDDSWNLARQYQVTGVPCFISNNIVMNGCQPYEELERFVQFLMNKDAEDNQNSSTEA